MVDTNLHSGSEYFFDASSTQFSYAVNDIRQASSRLSLVTSLVRGEFVNRYNGTTLGVLWVTITTLMTVSGLAVLYSQLFGHSLESHFPYVCVGIIVWGMLSTLITDSADVFPASSGIITQIPIPLSIFAFRNVGRAIVNLLLRLFVLVGVLMFVDITPALPQLFLALIGVVAILWIGFWTTLFIGTISTRFRDFQQLVSAAMTFAFFMTPVFWSTNRLGEMGFVVDYNPLYHLLHVVRGNIIGIEVTTANWIWVGSLCCVSFLLGFSTFGMFARRLRYWC